MFKMRNLCAVGMLLIFLVHSGACLNFMGGMLVNPGTMLSAARYMTQILMRNMAQKRTSNVPCVEHVSRSAVSFFNEAALSLQLGRLLQMTQRRSITSQSAAVPLSGFCRLANVRRLREASITFVSRMSCLGVGAVDDTDRLFRSLVFTIEHVCRDGGKASQKFMDDARQCRKLDDEHEARLNRMRHLHRSRRSVTAAPLQPSGRRANISTVLLVTLPAAHGARIAGVPLTTAATIGAATGTPTHYTSLQECLDDVNALLPTGARLSPQEELTDFLLTLPALLPRLLRQDGLLQFCPALLKGGDCAFLSLRQCPVDTQQTMARFFNEVIRGILCDGIPEDEALKQLIWYKEVKEMYFRL